MLFTNPANQSGRAEGGGEARILIRNVLSIDK